MGNSPPDEDELVILCDCADNAEAGLLRSLFESEDLFVQVTGEHHRAMVTSLGTHIRLPLWVKRRDLARAKELLEARERGELLLDAPALKALPEDRIPEGRRRRRRWMAGAILGFPIVMLALMTIAMWTHRHWGWGWVDYKNERLSASFPDTPHTSTRQIPDLQGVHFGLAVFVHDGRTGCDYSVTEEDHPMRAEALFTGARANMLKMFSASAYDFESPSLVDTLPARNVGLTGTFRSRAVELRARWIASPNGPVVGAMACPKGQLPEEDATKFFDSIHVFPQQRDPFGNPSGSASPTTRDEY